MRAAPLPAWRERRSSGHTVSRPCGTRGRREVPKRTGQTPQDSTPGAGAPPIPWAARNVASRAVRKAFAALIGHRAACLHTPPVELVPDRLAGVVQGEELVFHIAAAGDQRHDDALALDLAGDDVARGPADVPVRPPSRVGARSRHAHERRGPGLSPRSCARQRAQPREGRAHGPSVLVSRRASRRAVSTAKSVTRDDRRLVLCYGFNPNNPSNALSNESLSLDERLPSFLITSFLSIVDTAGFINDGITRPAFFQSSITYSSGSSVSRVLLMITSDEISLCLFDLMITAGRFFDVLWSLNGNSTSTTSDLSKIVICSIVVVIPDSLKRCGRLLQRRPYVIINIIPGL